MPPIPYITVDMLLIAGTVGFLTFGWVKLFRTWSKLPDLICLTHRKDGRARFESKKSLPVILGITTIGVLMMTALFAVSKVAPSPISNALLSKWFQEYTCFYLAGLVALVMANTLDAALQIKRSLRRRIAILCWMPSWFVIGTVCHVIAKRI